MNDVQADACLLRALCRTLGAKPDGPRTPDIDALARKPAPFEEKKQLFKEELLEEFTRTV